MMTIYNHQPINVTSVNEMLMSHSFAFGRRSTQSFMIYATELLIAGNIVDAYKWYSTIKVSGSTENKL